jgi:hypothetical protein
MNKKILLGLAAFLAISAIVIFVFVRNNNPAVENCSAVSGHSCNATDTDVILFYGDGCPHCAIVDKYIKDNNIEAKFQFVKKEVFYNTSSAEFLGQKAQACGLDLNSIGVPFLWNGPEGKYFIGDQEIKCFLGGKVNQ